MKEFLTEHYILAIIIVVSIIIAALLGRWIYFDSARHEGSKWKRVVLALQGLNSNGLITYLLMRRKVK